jgi:starch-binding outer membrane protein, SusD/RagB family
MKYTCLLNGLLLCSVLLQTGCRKYLETKSDQNLTTPSTLSDLQALLNNEGLYRAAIGINVGTDEYYLPYEDWQAENSQDENTGMSYVWHPSWDGNDDWVYQYVKVFYANTILESLEKIPAAGKQEEWNRIRGSALFFRAYAFYTIAQVYAPPYDKNSASHNLGIPLRMKGDMDETITRSTVAETYNRILEDLNTALSLLPVHTINKTQPGKAAVHAMLARIYLLMGKYNEAKQHAASCLALKNTLMDFNELDPSSDAPIALFNEEVILYMNTSDPLNIYDWVVKADSVLYRSFDEHDKRKTVFFRDNGDGTHFFKGSYNGDIYYMFNGLAVDEVYLILAEAEARLGNKDASLTSLNHLLSHRWDPAYFVPVTAVDANAALHLVIQERRKELIYRGLRWPDLRRLNKEPEFAVTLTRFSGANAIQLPPNDPRYTCLIPQDVIKLTGIPQNPR